jgi:hypothetical protein
MTIEAILDQCLEDIRQRHASIADCLARYPEHAKQLEPLLRTALALEQAAGVQPTPEFKQGLRARILGFSKPEETEPIQGLLSSSDAAEKSGSKDADLDSQDQESPTSVSLVPPAKQRK